MTKSTPENVEMEREMSQNYATPIRIDKGPSRAKDRRALCQKFLQMLNAENDERQIDSLVPEYLQRAKVSGQRAANNENKEDVRKFLADTLMLFLLASEPQSRASKLEAKLYTHRQINKHEEMTLLVLILKALGPTAWRRSRRATAGASS